MTPTDSTKLNTESARAPRDSEAALQTKEYASGKESLGLPEMTVDHPELLGSRILIVDDQLADAQMLGQILVAAGYSRIDAADDCETICALHRAHRYDLILLNLELSGCDAFELIAALRAIEGDGFLPVLAMAGECSQKMRAWRAGVRDYIRKPFYEIEVLARVRNLLELGLLHGQRESRHRHIEQAVHARTAELRESEAHFRRLVELASDWHWEQDENGSFTRISGPAMEMLGIDDKHAAACPERRRRNEHERAQLDEKLAMRRPFLDFVYSRVDADGRERHLQTSGEPKFDEAGRFVGYRGIGMDVTGRVPTRGDLQRESDLKRFREAMDSSACAILLTDRSSMRFVDVNAAACRMFGYSREELLASGPDALAADPGDDKEREYDRLIAGGGDSGFRAAQLLRKDGSRLIAQVHRQASCTDTGWIVVKMVLESDAPLPR